MGGIVTQGLGPTKIHCARCGKELAIAEVRHGAFPDHMMPMCADCADRQSDPVA